MSSTNPHTNTSDTAVNTPLDAALLIAALRHLWRLWRERARSASSSAEGALWRQAALDLEVAIEDNDRRRRSWEALRVDIAQEVLRALESRPQS